MISPQSSGLPKLVPSPLLAAGQYDGRQISLSVHPLYKKKAIDRRGYTCFYNAMLFIQVAKWFFRPRKDMIQRHNPLFDNMCLVVLPLIF